MKEIITAIQATPMPTIMVVGGIVFLILAVAGGIAGKIEVSPERQKWAGIIGVVLLFSGIALYVIPPSPIPDELSAPPDPLKLLETAQAWPVVLRDSFDTNDAGWYDDGIKRDDLEFDRSIANGKYVWELEAIQGSIWWWEVPDNLDPISDFYLAVEAKLVSGSEDDSEYGVVFRREGNDIYLFRVTGHQLKVDSIYEDEWGDLTKWLSADIQLREVNRLAVIAEGSHFRFYINDRFVSDAEDHRLKRGNAGLFIRVWNAGDKAIVEFDDFELRRKP